MVQWVKDPVFSLQQLRSLLGMSSIPGLIQAVGTAKKQKQKQTKPTKKTSKVNKKQTKNGFNIFSNTFTKNNFIQSKFYHVIYPFNCRYV